MDRRQTVFAVVALVTLALDQATKAAVRATLAPGERHPVIPGLFDIVHARNPGAAFGMMVGDPLRFVVFAGVTIVGVVLVLDLVRRLDDTDRVVTSGLALVLAGIAGNALDRLRLQHVTDFLRFYTDDPALAAWLVRTVGMSEWPSFNVADSALVVGILLALAGVAMPGGDDGLAGEPSTPGPGSASPPDGA
ncbi:MAG: signal peptidase II [Alphaproteobacteria bacterium]|nr:signal peptidase II [Alphaproteobacteria bacterium]